MCSSIQFNCNELVYHSYYHTEYLLTPITVMFKFELNSLSCTFEYIVQLLVKACHCAIMKVLNFSYVNIVLENCVSTKTVVYDCSFTNNYTTDYLSVEPTTVD